MISRGSSIFLSVSPKLFFFKLSVIFLLLQRQNGIRRNTQMQLSPPHSATLQFVAWFYFGTFVSPSTYAATTTFLLPTTDLGLCDADTFYGVMVEGVFYVVTTTTSISVRDLSIFNVATTQQSTLQIRRLPVLSPKSPILFHCQISLFSTPNLVWSLHIKSTLS